MIKEIALTIGRHEIMSPITDEEVTESFFGRVVEEPLNVAEHMKTVRAHLKGVPLDVTIVVYVTGLTPLFQAVFAAWLDRNHTENVIRPIVALHYPLVFAHYDRDAKTYVFRDALTGKAIHQVFFFRTTRWEPTEKPKSS
jgi:hypothetical protein